MSVPVRAFPATTSADEVHLHQLHADCGQRIRQQKHCPTHGPVEPGAIVSGYPCAPDQYLVVDAAELEQLRPAQDRALVLERFFAAGQVDPVLYAGRTLYLLPDGLAAQPAYAILADALVTRGKWALGRVVLSQRRQLALVRPAGRILALHVLHHAEHVRPASALDGDLRPASVSAVERQLAAQLVDAGSQPFAWSDYRDDTVAQFTALIEAKLRGQPPATPAEEEPPVLNLLAALQESVKAVVRSETAAAEPVKPTRNGRKRAAARRSA